LLKREGVETKVHIWKGEGVVTRLRNVVTKGDTSKMTRVQEVMGVQGTT